MTQAAPQPSSSSRPDRFHERLTVPWWWWLASLVVIGLLGYEINLAAYQQTWSLAAYPVLAVLLWWLLWTMSRTTIRVDANGDLHAGKATLPADVIARGAAIAASQRSAAMGRQLDPAAFVVHHAWIKTMVLVVLDDPDDPTPYWLLSTRHPEQVLAALGLGDAGRDAQTPNAAQS